MPTLHIRAFHLPPSPDHHQKPIRILNSVKLTPTRNWPLATTEFRIRLMWGAPVALAARPHPTAAGRYVLYVLRGGTIGGYNTLFFLAISTREALRRTHNALKFDFWGRHVALTSN